MFVFVYVMLFAKLTNGMAMDALKTVGLHGVKVVLVLVVLVFLDQSVGACLCLCT